MCVASRPAYGRRIESGTGTAFDTLAAGMRSAKQYMHRSGAFLDIEMCRILGWDTLPGYSRRGVLCRSAVVSLSSPNVAVPEVVKCRSTTMCITAKARAGGRKTTHSTFFTGASHQAVSHTSARL